MIKYRTVTIDATTASKSIWKQDYYQVDMHELRLQIQGKIDEMDDMGYELMEMEAVIQSNGSTGGSRTQGYVLIFKSRE